VAHHRETIVKIRKSVGFTLVMGSRLVFHGLLFGRPVPAPVIGRKGFCVRGVAGIVGLVRGTHVCLFCVVQEMFLDFRDPFVVATVLGVLGFFAVGHLFAVFEFVDYEGGRFEGVWGLGAGGCKTEVVAVREMDLFPG
jgi:hypothetical protein